MTDACPPPAPGKPADAPRPIVWPCWPPQLSLVPSSPNPRSQPSGTALRNAFTWAYQTLDAKVWDLPLRGQSDAVIRAVAKACLSFRPGCAGFDYMTIDPQAHGREYSTIAALANLAAGDERELADFLAESHAIVLNDGYDDYPAGRLDPDGRRPPRVGPG